MFSILSPVLMSTKQNIHIGMYVVYHISMLPITSVCCLSHQYDSSRYIDVLIYGLKPRKEKPMKGRAQVIFANRDISLLRLFEAFLEGRPQLVLQINIMWKRYLRDGIFLREISLIIYGDSTNPHQLLYNCVLASVSARPKW